MKQLFTLAAAILCTAMMMAQSSQSSLPVNCGDSVTIQAKPATGWHFVQWSDGDTNEIRRIEASSDSTLRAYFAIDQYSIVFKNWDLTTLDSAVWNYGEVPYYTGTPTRPDNERYHYTFKGWDHAISSVMGEDTYIAQYDSALIGYTLTVGGDYGTTTGSGIYTYGEVVTITATPDNCYHFTQWSNTDKNATTTIIITGDMTITAQFDINTYNITVISDDAAQGTVVISE
jgi:hypothetical protein